jgi:hypothetical protein
VFGKRNLHWRPALAAGIGISKSGSGRAAKVLKQLRKRKFRFESFHLLSLVFIYFPESSLFKGLRGTLREKLFFGAPASLLPPPLLLPFGGGLVLQNMLGPIENPA